MDQILSRIVLVVFNELANRMTPIVTLNLSWKVCNLFSISWIYFIKENLWNLLQLIIFHMTVFSANTVMRAPDLKWHLKGAVFRKLNGKNLKYRRQFLPIHCETRYFLTKKAKSKISPFSFGNRWKKKWMKSIGVTRWHWLMMSEIFEMAKKNNKFNWSCSSISSIIFQIYNRVFKSQWTNSLNSRSFKSVVFRSI